MVITRGVRCGSTNFTSADNPHPQASGPRTVRVRNCNGDSCPRTVRIRKLGSDYTVSNRQCLGPHTVKHWLCYIVYCSVQYYGSVLKLLSHWHLHSRLVLQTILVALDLRMVRICRCLCLADPRTARVRKKMCGSGSTDIRVRSPHTSGYYMPNGRSSKKTCCYYASVVFVSIDIIILL